MITLHEFFHQLQGSANARQENPTCCSKLIEIHNYFLYLMHNYFHYLMHNYFHYLATEKALDDLNLTKEEKSKEFVPQLS